MKLGTIDINKVYLGSTEVNKAMLGSTEVYSSGPDYSEPFYVEDISGSSNTLSIVKNNKSATTLTIQKSTDKINWTSMGSTSTTAITATIPAYSKMYLRCNSTEWSVSTQYDYYNKIYCSGNFNVGGNIMSLLYGSNFNGSEREFPSGSSRPFYKLFYNSTQLISAEKLLLPVTTLVSDCYANMFQGCSALTTAPELPATTLVQQCYYGMFLQCTSLNHVKCFARDISATNCLGAWLGGITGTGLFEGDMNLSWVRGTTIPTNWVFKDIDGRNDDKIEYVTIVNTNNNNITLSRTAVKVNTTYNVNYPNLNLEYSYDKNTWNTWSTYVTVTIYANSVIYLKGINTCLTTYKSGYGIGAYSLRCSGNFSVRGNIASLIKGDYFAFYDPFVKLDSSSSTTCLFAGLFKESSNLVDATNLCLKGNTLRNNNDLTEMFSGCTKLVSGPRIEINTMNNYYGATSMFKGCTSLTNVVCITNTVNSEGFQSWMNNTPSTGTFTTKSSANFPTSVYGIPSGWTRINV